MNEEELLADIDALARSLNLDSGTLIVSPKLFNTIPIDLRRKIEERGYKLVVTSKFARKATAINSLLKPNSAL